ncbi:heterokaryon incompatibility protein-domain-containing protein [Lophiotrema nucula]|uniref:Heterokaryon incompatibility protein-domain-containing protein n=1 Tax=Lophiotrema nucula TaxID=690887 RepID=A0A6A5ZBP3_9PLEO|nr:heterokaryon incompatibility protein-domain-containing protein [Lophiotrema nucula]
MDNKLSEAAGFAYPRYQHEPLQSPEHIRLIYLEPASDRCSPLTCEVKQHKLNDQSLNFEAISYTWGPPVFPGKLLCSVPDVVQSYKSALLPITESLATALKNFRRPDSVRYIWADAVCIDQSNPLERNVQVAIMDQIYRAASSVLVWLGEADSETESALEFCEMLAAKLPACGMDLSDPFRRPRSDTPQSQAARQRLAFEPSLQAKGIALRNLVSRTWFTRRWIVQEVYLGRHVILYTGSYELKWEVFSLSMALVKCLRRDQYQRAGNSVVSIWCADVIKYKNFQSPWGLACQIAEGRHYGPNGSSMEKWEEGLLSLLKSFPASICSDERDLLFAVLAMTNETWLKVDYTLSVEEIFTNFAIGLIENSKSYNVLHHIRDKANRARESVKEAKKLDLPSWVPDWRDMHYGERNFSGARDPGDFDTLLRPFGAGGIGPIRYTLSSCTRELTVQGILVGTLHSPSWEVLSDLRNYSQIWEDFYEDKMSKNISENVEYWGQERSEQEIVALVKWLELYDKYVVSDGLSSIQDESRLHPLALTLIAANKIDATHYAFKKDTSPDDITRTALTFFQAAMNGEYQFTDGRIVVVGARYVQACTVMNARRTFFIIEGNDDTNGERYIGLGPRGMDHGDLVAVFTGAETPFVLRPEQKDDGTKYRLVGECYVYGMMDGEKFTKHGAHREQFTLI